MDFNLSLESFEPHIAGVRDFINLSSQSIKKPPILFTSSVSTLSNWHIKHSGEKVPEKAFHDMTIPSPMGYGESKYIAEMLLEAGSEKCGVPAIIARVGQLAGPVAKKGGMWNKQEWLPSVSLWAILSYRSVGTWRLLSSPRQLTLIVQFSDHSKLQISRQSTLGSPESGHRILGPGRHHRQHHRRPRSRQCKQRQSSPIISLVTQIAPLQPREPLSRLLAHPRANRHQILPRPPRQRQERIPRTRPLWRLARGAPGLGGVGHRRRGQEPGHQTARFLRRDERAGG